MFCSKCGHEAADSSLFCPSCGASLAVQPSAEHPRTAPESPKHKNNRPILIIGIAAVAVLALIGSGIGTYFAVSHTNSKDETTTAKATDAAIAATEKTNEPTKKTNAETTTKKAAAAESTKKETTQAETKAKTRALTKSELKKISNNFSYDDTSEGGEANLPFLTCVYDKPSEIDLDEVFYTGVGIYKSPTDSEEKTLVESYGFSQGGLDNINCYKITADDANAFLQKKTGLTIKQFSKKWSWTYAKEYDAYFNLGSDCNLPDPVFKSGSLSGDVYTLVYNAEIYSYSSDSADFEVKFKQVDGSLRFISNKPVK